MVNFTPLPLYVPPYPLDRRSDRLQRQCQRVKALGGAVCPRFHGVGVEVLILPVGSDLV
jgi:hypothetical protein